MPHPDLKPSPTAAPSALNVAAPNRSFRILSLDGGGYKGMFSAAILDRLAADLQIDLLSHFDRHRRRLGALPARPRRRSGRSKDPEPWSACRRPVER